MANQQQTGAAYKRAREFVDGILAKHGDQEYIFRGTSKSYSVSQDGISSTLYRWISQQQTTHPGQYPTITDIERRILDKARRHHPDGSLDTSVLTTLRHFGGVVNLIDFTRDLHNALFFACSDNLGEDGELVMLDANSLRRLADPIHTTPSSIMFIEPSQIDASRIRVVAQDSVFVYPPKGYVPLDNCLLEPVPKHLKLDIADYIRKVHNIYADTIYNDLFGLIQNTNTYNLATVHYHRGNALLAQNRSPKSIDEFSKAIELDPNYAQAYRSRARATLLSGQGDGYRDTAKAIALDPTLRARQ